MFGVLSMSKRVYVKKLITVPADLWREFEVEATRKFGHYGAIKRAVEEAIRLWLEVQRKRESQ
jgi:hypothetical protein